MDLDNILWVEKYRPKSLEEVSLRKGYKEKFQEYIDQKSIPHLLFYGSQGSGKTTVARIICDSICSRDDILFINGSNKNERSISNIPKIEAFCQIKPFDSKIRVVFIDEADNLTLDAFKALRSIFELYASNARFLWTCNYIDKIPDPIKSRFQCFEFTQFSKEYVIVLCENILISEEVSYDSKALEIIVDTFFPDVRRIINTLQQLTVNKHLRATNLDDLITIENTIINNVLNYIDACRKNDINQINTSISTIQQIVSENNSIIDWNRLYIQLFNNDKLSIPLKVLCNKYALSHQNTISPLMNFMAFIYEILSFSQDMLKLIYDTNNSHLKGSEVR